jgi:Holliday junction resolvasome RuvABC endonuclease subunit
MTKVMGIDLGQRKVALSLWTSNILEAESYEVPGGLRGDELLHLSEFVYDAAYQFRPHYIFIEDTLVGNNVRYSIKLAQVMGAVLAKLAQLQEDLDAYPLDELVVLPVNVGTWKKEVVGNGHADKQMVREYLTGLDRSYAEICGSDQDKYDAACIGLYGLLVAARSNSLMEEFRPSPG